MDELLLAAAEPPANRPLMTTAFQLTKLLIGLIALLLCLALLLILALVCLLMMSMMLKAITGEPVDLFIVSESYRFAGIIFLLTKFWEKRTAAGLSLKSLELMAVYMGIRLYCNVVSRGVWVHEVPFLMSTLWISYMIRFKLRSTHMESRDNFPLCYLVVPCLLLSIAIPLSKQHISEVDPHLTEQFILNRMLWAFNVYLKAVSVLPQLWLMHNTKIVEPYKAYYVVTLGIVPFITIVNCVVQVLLPGGYFGKDLWRSMMWTSQAFQTLTLAYFCYWYIRWWLLP